MPSESIYGWDDSRNIIPNDSQSQGNIKTWRYYYASCIIPVTESRICQPFLRESYIRIYFSARGNISMSYEISSGNVVRFFKICQ